MTFSLYYLFTWILYECFLSSCHLIYILKRISDIYMRYHQLQFIQNVKKISFEIIDFFYIVLIEALK